MYTVTKVYAVGSTVRLASVSRVIKMSNGHVVMSDSSREAGHNVDNV